jgi:hypothetical protein
MSRWGKLQIPNTKSQKSSNNQIPNGLLSRTLYFDQVGPANGGGGENYGGGSWFNAHFSNVEDFHEPPNEHAGPPELGNEGASATIDMALLRSLD